MLAPEPVSVAFVKMAMLYCSQKQLGKIKAPLTIKNSPIHGAVK